MSILQISAQLPARAASSSSPNPPAACPFPRPWQKGHETRNGEVQPGLGRASPGKGTISDLRITTQSYRVGGETLPELGVSGPANLELRTVLGHTCTVANTHTRYRHKNPCPECELIILVYSICKMAILCTFATRFPSANPRAVPSYDVPEL